MSNDSNKIADDFVKLFGSMTSNFIGLKNEFDSAFKSKMEEFFSNMDFVKKEDFEVLKERVSSLEEELKKLKGE